MTRYRSTAAVTAALVLAAMGGSAAASESPAFDAACSNYYAQGLDADVPTVAATDFCVCLAEHYAKVGLGTEALDFFARTYSDDLTTFIHEYPLGETWMDKSFEADGICKTG